jgi:hypothetical protein
MPLKGHYNIVITRWLHLDTLFNMYIQSIIKVLHVILFSLFLHKDKFLDTIDQRSRQEI